jgi:hypothetical protein
MNKRNITPAVEVVSRSRKWRKALIPLTTLAAAGALAIGSGASFTSNSANAASVVASGTLTQSNSKSGAAVFNVTNLKPGDTASGDVTITNTGSLPAVFSVTETATNGFTDKTNLVMTVTQGSTTIFTGTFGTMGTQALGTFAAGEARTYHFSSNLKSSAGNAEQGKSASASYSWDASQTSTASNVNQPAATPANATAAN